jgi:hypothetical protein
MKEIKVFIELHKLSMQLTGEYLLKFCVHVV